eukprot:TRINITY_DN42_c0_g1_i2.p1 TRINITY_DN42_c0_g1~~TRINITY_DN42_c0_g1_i2.p1  ORF type:complete len:131 (-),score=13.02 TRINITY_DN42_c0_g1_i2:251-643(-)
MTAISSSKLRLMSDLKNISDDPPEGVSAAPTGEDNLYVWDATIFGPEDCPWEGICQTNVNSLLTFLGGIFSLKLKFPEDYPTAPPKVRFVSTMFHPNVYGDGSLCLDIIQDKWKPIYNVAAILLSIRVCS